jgi:Flp pilus assembly protein TadG
MAIVLPLLLLVLFAILDFGRMFSAQMSLTAAAREGARVASFGDDPTDRVRTIAGGDVDVSVVACPAGGIPAGDARVTVSSRFTFITPIALIGGGFGGEATLTGQGVMPCQ